MLADLHKFSVADRPFAGGFPRQKFDDDFPPLAQRGDVRGEFPVMPDMLRQDGARRLAGRRQA